MDLRLTRHAKLRLAERLPSISGPKNQKLTAAKAYKSDKQSEILTFLRKQHRGKLYTWRNFHYRLHLDHVWVFERIAVLHRVYLITVYPHRSISELQIHQAFKFYGLDELY